jgi:ABC-type uncharacterized transport system permease subunit
MRYSWAVLRTLRAVPTLLRVGLADAVAYRAEFLVWLLSTNMPLVMLALWSAVARDGPVGRFGQEEFVAYYLAALVVRLLTGAWVIWELNFEIRQGTLSFRLLRPVHPLVAYAAENVAAVPLRLVLSLPVTLLLTSVRLLLTPAFVRLDYGLPGFPPDPYGFTAAERLQGAGIALEYLLNDEPISFLGDLRFDDGSPVYN